jgi:hypothetical protein
VAAVGPWQIGGCRARAPLLTESDPTPAKGIWAMQDLLRWPDGRELHGYGHYHETYERIDGAWRIKTLKLTRLRTDVTAPDAA